MVRRWGHLRVHADLTFGPYEVDSVGELCAKLADLQQRLRPVGGISDDWGRGVSRT